VIHKEIIEYLKTLSNKELEYLAEQCYKEILARDGVDC